MTFTRGTINLGLKEVIRQEAAGSGRFPGRRAEDLGDADLFIYSARREKSEWLCWLVDNGDFYGKRGAIKRECKRTFEEALFSAVDRNDAEVARKLMDRGAKLNYIPATRLYLTIMKRRYEMAELLLGKGIRLSSKQKRAECLVQADERMREIIIRNNSYR
jgi:hypothetical protein